MLMNERNKVGGNIYATAPAPVPLEKTGGGGMRGDEYTVDDGMSKARKKDLKTAHCPLCNTIDVRKKSTVERN